MKTAEEVRLSKQPSGDRTAVAAAHDMLRQASINKDCLWFDGIPLTSERVKKLINVKLMECDCVAQHTIVAGGEQACDPHNEGTGPLPAHRSIIFDVFPRSATNRYFADMSRTVVRGTPSPELKRLYQTVLAAQEEAITKVKDGADGKRIHQGICARFEKAGYKTGLVNGRMQGYFHGTGHGVGSTSMKCRASAAPGHAQEGSRHRRAGLYYPVRRRRIEDMVLVTKDGAAI